MKVVEIKNTFVQCYVNPFRPEHSVVWFRKLKKTEGRKEKKRKDGRIEKKKKKNKKGKGKRLYDIES
jgi:hypothetical protein